MERPDRAGEPRRVTAFRSTIAAVRWCTAALVLCMTGCGDLGAPPGPPYLAIVTDVTGWPGAELPADFTFHVRELSGTLRFDRRFRAESQDTIIVSVPPASYRVDAVGIPGRCVVMGGTGRGIVLGDGDNTGVVRFSVECRSVLGIAVLVDGWEIDQEFAYRVRDPEGGERIGIVAANDTAFVSEGTAGPYEVQLTGVASTCSVVSDGATRQTVLVDSVGGAMVAFRIACSESARRPRILDLAGSYVLGSSAFAFRVVDPDGDIEGYAWDLTDCNGNSVLPDRRERTRTSLRGGRGGAEDTLTVIGAHDVGLASSDLVGRCTEIRVFDRRQNVSAIATHRIGPVQAHPPAVRFLDARLVGTTHLQTILEASDPDGDIVGHFVMLRLRDGVLAPPDGKPDLGIIDAAGGLGTTVPLIPLGSRVAWDDIYAVIVWVVDRRGNAVRREDTNVFP